MASFSIRINTLKISREAFLELLRKEGIAYATTDISGEALTITDFPKEEFTELSLYTEDLCYIQSLSSQLPVVVLDPEPGERVLDLCAAPGGKTIQIAGHINAHLRDISSSEPPVLAHRTSEYGSLQSSTLPRTASKSEIHGKNGGEIVANDVSRARLFKTKALLEKYGVRNVILKQSRGEKLWQKEKESFDRVLVDAPCSMCQALPQKKIKSLAKRQRALLHSAYTCTKPGGTLVYSTCTLTNEENEETVEWLLAREEGAALEAFEVGETLKAPSGMLRIKGDELMEPFFIAKFRKTG